MSTIEKECTLEYLKYGPFISIIQFQFIQYKKKKLMIENQVKSFNSKYIFEIEWQKAIGLQSSLFCDKNHEQIRQKHFVVVNMLLMKHQKLEK